MCKRFAIFKDPYMSAANILVFSHFNLCALGDARYADYAMVQERLHYQRRNGYIKVSAGSNEPCKHILEIRRISDDTQVARQTLDVICDRSDYFRCIFAEVLKGKAPNDKKGIDKLEEFNVIKLSDKTVVYQLHVDDKSDPTRAKFIELFFTLLCIDRCAITATFDKFLRMQGDWSPIRLIRNGVFEVYKVADYYGYGDLSNLLLCCAYYYYSNISKLLERLNPHYYANGYIDLVQLGCLRFDIFQIRSYLSEVESGANAVLCSLKEILDEYKCIYDPFCVVYESDMRRLDELIVSSRVSNTVNPEIVYCHENEWRIVNFLELRYG